MADEKRDYPNSGILFENDRKRDERDRTHQGSADVDCPHCGVRSQFWLSAWVKEGRKGKFLSLAFKLKPPLPDDGRASAAAGADDDLDVFGISRSR
ncbi:MAG: hypothetical protein ACLQAT_20120 [Candidatus Binataceae bacterium]